MSTTTLAAAYSVFTTLGANSSNNPKSTLDNSTSTLHVIRSGGRFVVSQDRCVLRSVENLLIKVETDASVPVGLIE